MSKIKRSRPNPAPPHYGFMVIAEEKYAILFEKKYIVMELGPERQVEKISSFDSIYDAIGFVIKKKEELK